MMTFRVVVVLLSTRPVAGLPVCGLSRSAMKWVWLYNGVSELEWCAVVCKESGKGVDSVQSLEVRQSWLRWRWRVGCLTSLIVVCWWDTDVMMVGEGSPLVGVPSHQLVLKSHSSVRHWLLSWMWLQGALHHHLKVLIYMHPAHGRTVLWCE